VIALLTTNPVSLRRRLAVGAALFVLAFALRVGFWLATPDADWPYSVYYKGDAPVWLAYAEAIKSGAEFEMGLPIRPPGMAYLLHFLWDGSPETLWRVQLAWCALGALIPALMFVVLVPAAGAATALLASTFAAVSTGLMILSTSLNNETPYLVLVLAAFALWEPLRRRPGWAGAAVWGALGGLACLVRVEHVVVFGLCTAFLALSWRRDGRALRGGGGAAMAVLLAAFAVSLLPWHLTAWSRIARFNERGHPAAAFSPEVLERIETATRHFSWDPAARETRDALPGFGRDFWSAFVAATVLYRGGDRIGPRDFAILEEAFGVRPEPLYGHPFVTSYGPLNFFLANHPGATAGFSRDALEMPPPLEGGGGRYPPVLVSGLPPEDKLLFLYPPHLHAFNHGYALGLRWIREHPGDFLALAGAKLRGFWAGAAGGVTGYNFPLGIEGVRRSVDLVVAGGTGPAVWRFLVLALCGIGAAWAASRPALFPWLALLAAKAAAAALFFGYARMGATAIPATALLAALAVTRLGIVPLLDRRPGWAKPLLVAGAGAVLLAVAAETHRFLDPPVLYLQDREVIDEDPYPPGLYIDQRINVRN
jgi:hypothetical protein